MSYFGFLLLFLVIPILALLAFRNWGQHASRTSAVFPGGTAPWVALAVQIALAVLYTTPWDNYLVAGGVWYYNPAQVSGVLLGYVPLEEYTFFVLEAVLIGVWWQILITRLDSARRFVDSASLRLWSSLAVAVLCGLSLIPLVLDWKPGTYLGLIMIWALPPIMLQLAFGADILWYRRELLAGLILLPAVYLSLSDWLAIRNGIWAIDPAQSTGILLAGLPLEEGLFFLVTVVLLSFGMTLSLSPESRSRLAWYVRRLRARISCAS